MPRGNAPGTGCIQGNLWSPLDLSILRMLYPRLGRFRTAWVLRRTEAATQRKARLIGVRGPGAADPWTTEENIILTDGWHRLSFRVLMKKLPGRTRLAIIQQAKNELHLGPRFQGDLSVNQACALVGCCAPLLKKIAIAEGVAMQHKHGYGHGARTVVDEEEIIEAAKRYFSRENLGEYLKRSGMDERKARRILIAKELKTPGVHSYVRLLPDEWDSIMSEGDNSNDRREESSYD